ncbi:Protein of unknown function [Weissella confusa LBAE C39-2]|nr:Protein of unknown function [Weissella confusa LBAE C39-2]
MYASLSVLTGDIGISFLIL